MTNLTSLSHAMAYEWTRIRTTRLAWYLAAVAVIATAVAAWAYSAIAMRVAGSTTVDPREAVTFVISRPSFAPVVAGLLGVVAIGSDYRYGTMRTTLLVTPRRGIALGAKPWSRAALERGSPCSICSWRGPWPSKPSTAA